MEESSWATKSQKFEVEGSLASVQYRKIQSEVIRRDLKDWKVKKELAKYRNAWK